uniref:Kinesin motor domain-containing protein n=1 Tax=Peronospora matthiolae TaxID=2874970 RepID=A0AAV1VN05_9STRA
MVMWLQACNQKILVGQSAVNDKSLRSHIIFRIVVKSKQKDVPRRLLQEDGHRAMLVSSLEFLN